MLLVINLLVGFMRLICSEVSRQWLMGTSLDGRMGVKELRGQGVGAGHTPTVRHNGGLGIDESGRAKKLAWV
jgi:hypothetical protein